MDGETEKKSFSLLYLIPIIIVIGSMGLLYYINHTGKSLASIFPGRHKNNVEVKAIPNIELISIAENSNQLKPDEPTQPIESDDALIEPAIEISNTELNNNLKNEVLKINNAQPKIKEVDKITDNTLHYNLVSDKTGKYFIIVGSFAEKTNALKMNKKIIRNGGIPAIIAPDDSNKFYKVAVEDFTELNTAIAKLNTYKPQFGESIWVMAY